MNIAQSLQSISPYPIPLATLQDIAEGLGFRAESELTQELRGSRAFRKAKALTYLYLSEAPDVSQGGISYSFSDDERKRLRNRGEAILDEIGDKTAIGVAFGYMGEDL